MIIAIKEKDKTVIGCSITDYTSGLTDKDYVDMENLPIRFTPDGKLFAFANLAASSDMLLYDDKFINMEISPKKIITDIIPYMKKKFKDNYYPLGENETWGNALVICYDGHIYDIDPRFNFYEISDYACHGYNVETLKSTLDFTAGLPAEQRIVEAVRFAGKMKKSNGFPLVIADTRTKELNYIYEGEKVDERGDSI